MVMVREEELSWWQFEWEWYTYPVKPELQWVLAPTGRVTKQCNHMAMMQDPIDVQAAH